MRIFCTILAAVIFVAFLAVGYVATPILNTFGTMFDWWDSTIGSVAVIAGCGVIGLISGGTIFMIGYLYSRVKKLENKLRRRSA